MDRRIFLVLLLAGCAGPAPPPKVEAPIPPPPPGPAPSLPTAPTPSGDAGFDAWRAQFRTRAVAAGLSGAFVDRELAGVTPNPRVITLDSAQPEFSKPIGDYIKGTVSDERIARGRRYRTELPFWPAVEQKYGVPRDILERYLEMFIEMGLVERVACGLVVPGAVFTSAEMMGGANEAYDRIVGLVSALRSAGFALGEETPKD